MSGNPNLNTDKEGKTNTEIAINGLLRDKIEEFFNLPELTPEQKTAIFNTTKFNNFIDTGSKNLDDFIKKTELAGLTTAVSGLPFIGWLIAGTIKGTALVTNLKNKTDTAIKTFSAQGPDFDTLEKQLRELKIKPNLSDKQINEILEKIKEIGLDPKLLINFLTENPSEDAQKVIAIVLHDFENQVENIEKKASKIIEPITTEATKILNEPVKDLNSTVELAEAEAEATEAEAKAAEAESKLLNQNIARSATQISVGGAGGRFQRQKRHSRKAKLKRNRKTIRKRRGKMIRKRKTIRKRKRKTIRKKERKR